MRRSIDRQHNRSHYYGSSDTKNAEHQPDFSRHRGRRYGNRRRVWSRGIVQVPFLLLPPGELAAADAPDQRRQRQNMKADENSAKSDELGRVKIVHFSGIVPEKLDCAIFHNIRAFCRFSVRNPAIISPSPVMAAPAAFDFQAVFCKLSCRSFFRRGTLA